MFSDMTQAQTLRTFAAAAAATGGYIPEAFEAGLADFADGDWRGLDGLRWTAIVHRVDHATEVAWNRTAAEGGGAIAPNPIEVTMRGDRLLRLVYTTSLGSKTVATLIRHGRAGSCRPVGELQLYRGDEQVTEGYRADIARAVLAETSGYTVPGADERIEPRW